MNDYYMTIPEMQSYLRISKKTAYKIAGSGAIPIYHLSPRKTLVRRTDVEKYIRRRKSKK